MEKIKERLILEELEDLLDHLYKKYNEAPLTVGEAITRVHRIKNRIQETF